jgi:hypothetical protein
MARIAIYVPDQLKARMDACDDKVNWSSVAQPAFERALAMEEAKMMDLGDRQQAIARLKASRDDYAAEEMADGEAAGREWALKRADYSELVRLRAYRTEAVEQGELERHMSENVGYTFWEDSVGFSAFSGYDLSEPWVAGFINGALAVFNDLENDL